MRPRGDEGGHSELEEETQRRHAKWESVGKEGTAELLKAASASPTPNEMAGLTDKLPGSKEPSMKRTKGNKEQGQVRRRHRNSTNF